MAKQTIKVETPFGTFTRTTASAYKFAAVTEQRDDPEKGVIVAGTRKGDASLPARFSVVNPDYRIPCTRYHVVWSKTWAGAVNNAEGYPYDHVKLLGVYPVQEAE
jgi:hypothetical protein